MENDVTIHFNTGEPNSRLMTFNGEVDIVRNGEVTDLYVRGPRGGLRHLVCLPWHDAVSLGEELLRLHKDNTSWRGDSMHTSSFAQFYRRPDPRLVSIALKTPEWFQGRRYPALAPRLDMLVMEEEEYQREYQAILDRLDPRQIYEDLGPDAIMLCSEPPGAFCHRRLVAVWLEENLGLQVPELPQNYHPGQQDFFT